MNPKLILENAGLAGNEVKIYLDLLGLGSALAGEITKKSSINRTNVYDALERLIEKGLVSYVIKANRKYFEAAEPTRITKFLSEKQEELEQKKKLVNSILPELKAKRMLSKGPQEATIFKGRKGIKSVAEDVIKTKKELLVFGAEGKFVSLFTHYARQWHLKRKENRIQLKILFNEKIRKKKSKDKFPICQMRFCSNMQETPATTWIYGDKVAIMVWGEQPIATLIRSKEVAKSYKVNFDFLWELAKK
ncbi:MAG: helix-turn-helix domain-containing protein [Candidatus Woesearchaeota archaeon]